MGRLSAQSGNLHWCVTIEYSPLQLVVPVWAQLPELWLWP